MYDMNYLAHRMSMSKNTNNYLLIILLYKNTLNYFVLPLHLRWSKRVHENSFVLCFVLGLYFFFVLGNRISILL